MKAAANVIAVLGWGGFLVALWWPLVMGEMPALGSWLAAILFSLLTGLVVPSYLLRLELQIRSTAAGSAERAKAAGSRPGRQP